MSPPALLHLLCTQAGNPCPGPLHHAKKITGYSWSMAWKAPLSAGQLFFPRSLDVVSRKALLCLFVSRITLIMAGLNRPQL